MGSGKTSHHHDKKKAKRQKPTSEKLDQVSAKIAARKRLEIVLKCDTSGTIEAIKSSIISINLPGVEIDIISSGVGFNASS
jgi:translation initiation factor IF-2